MEHHTRLELATDAWKAPMLPLHQWCIRYALAYLKEGGIYIMHLYYIKFFVCCQIFQKRTASQSYILIAYSVAGEHVLPTTLAACFSGFPTPISRWKYSVCEVNSPRPKPWLVLARWMSSTSRLRKGYLYNTPQKATYQYKVLPLLTSKRAHAVVRATICSIRLLTHFGLKRRDHAEHSNS